MATMAATDEAEGNLATSVYALENIVSLGPSDGVQFLKREHAQRAADNQARDDASATLDAQGVPVKDFEAYESLVAELEALYGAQPSVNYVPPDPRFTNADYQPTEDAPTGNDATVDDPAEPAIADAYDGVDVEKALLPLIKPRKDGTNAPARALAQKAAETQEIGGDLDDEDLDKAVAALLVKADEDDDPPEKPDNPDKPSSKKTDADRIIEKLGAPPPPTPEEQAQDQAEAAADGPDDDDDDDADDDTGEKSMEDADLQNALADLEDDAYDLAKSLGGPFIGPHGGKWADPEHKIAWQPNDPHGAKAIHAQHPTLSTAKAHAVYKQAGGSLPLSAWQHHHIKAKKNAKSVGGVHVHGSAHLDGLPVGSKVTQDSNVLTKQADGDWHGKHGIKSSKHVANNGGVVTHVPPGAGKPAGAAASQPASAPDKPAIDSVHHELLGKFAAKAKAMQADDIKDSGDTEATGTYGKYTNRTINHLEAAHEHAKAGRHHAAAQNLQMAASSAKEAAGAIGEYGGHWAKLSHGLQSVSEVHGHGDYTKDPHWSAANHEQVQANAERKASIGKSVEPNDMHKAVSAVIGRDVGPGFTLAPHEAAQVRARLAGRPGFADMYKFAADSGFYGQK